MRRGTNKGYKDFQKCDSTYISCMYASPTATLPNERQIIMLFKDVKMCL